MNRMPAIDKVAMTMIPRPLLNLALRRVTLLASLLVSLLMAPLLSQAAEQQTSQRPRPPSRRSPRRSRPTTTPRSSRCSARSTRTSSSAAMPPTTLPGAPRSLPAERVSRARGQQPGTRPAADRNAGLAIPDSPGARGQQLAFCDRAGAEEIQNRRIGRNERSAIAVLRAYAIAQQEYASVDRNGDGVLQFAQKLASAPASSTACTGPPIPVGARRQPVRAADRRELGLPHRPQAGRSLPRLSLPHPHGAGQERARRRLQLRHQRSHGGRRGDGRVPGRSQ